jgi:Zn-dependent peptidase ImmA (M78 family)/plasmid maintenance system antidote protein VapI
MDAAIIERVREIIAELGITNREFALSIGLDEDKLSKTLNRRRRLSPLELARIAELSGKSTDWILTGKQERRVGVAARVNGAVANVETLGADLARRYVRAHDVLVELGRSRPIRPLPTLPETGRFVREGQAMAEWARTLLDEDSLLGDSEDFGPLIEEAFGVDIATVADLPAECDGLSFQDDNLRLIILAATPHWTRKRFTLAHELGHLLWRDAQDQVLTETVSPGAETDYKEKRANAFAGAFLMPEPSVLAFIDGRTVNEHLFHELVMRYKVSPSAMAARLTQLGQITKLDAQTLRGFGTQQSANALDRVTEAVAEATFARSIHSPRLMTTSFITAYIAGEVGTRPLESLTGLSGRDIRDIFNESVLSAVPPETDSAPDDEAQLVFTP